MPVFRWFRQLTDAIQSLTLAVVELADIQRQLGPALDRLEALEHSRHHFEAECEGMLLKADGKFKAATSAEQRERQLKKANERRLTDPFGAEGEVPLLEGRDPDVRVDAEGGEAQGMPAVRLAVASNDKAHAVRTKWGIA